MFTLLTTEQALLEHLPAPDTDPRLLPAHLAAGDNSRRMRHYRAALHKAMDLGRITPAQREQLALHYGRGLRKSEIAAIQRCTCSAVSKSIKSGLRALREYIEMYMEIYDDLEREFLEDEENGKETR